jgi:heptosyltransferase-2
MQPVSERDIVSMKNGTPKILIRGANWLGDAVMSIPALERLRAGFRDAYLCLLTSPGTADLFKTSGLVDDVIVYHRNERGAAEFLRTVRDLRKQQFDLAILFQNAFEAALLTALAGIPQRIGYRAQKRDLLLSIPIARQTRHSLRHQIHDYLDLVEEALKRHQNQLPIGTIPIPVMPRLKATDDQQAAAERLFIRFGLTPGDRMMIGLNVGATNSRAKQWPEQRFAELADLLIVDQRAKIVLLGAKAEREIAERVLAQMKQKGATNLAGETDLPTLIGVLARCHLIITNDTGSAHVAAALGRPTLTIFGPTNEFETAPLGPLAEIVRAEGIACARCMLRDCPIDHRCMRQISAGEIISRVNKHFTAREVSG